MARARRNRSSVAVAIQPAARCAIYTRKSTDEGLDRDFSSLDNQRERAEAFVDSQGWSALPTEYNDGGVSGGTMERPALKRLLDDVDAGLVDTVVCYRLDRISRSLVQFGRIHEFLEKRGVSLVSVTESINTTTPHGRMMVNVLLSFAQYERELIGERTRHKIEAARRHGKWTGGRPVLGYDTDDGRLVVNQDEADQVKTIFELYTETPSLVAVVEELDRRACRNKSWTTKTGRRCGGGQWNKITLRRLLTDPLYVGKQKLGADIFPGEHKPIVAKKLFSRVQRLLDANRSDGGANARNRYGALLRGLVRCSACNCAMTHVVTKKNGKVYRYHKCQGAQKRGAGSCPTKSIPADKIEQFVVDQIRRIGADPELQQETFRQALAQVAAERRGLKAEAKRLERDLAAARRSVESLVATLTDTKGAARDAVQTELAKAQEHVHTMETRLGAVRDREAELAASHVDQADLARALEAFDPIWNVLLTPEKERVLKLLIESIDYNAETQKLNISWRLAGLADFADEVGGG